MTIGARAHVGVLAAALACASPSDGDPPQSRSKPLPATELPVASIERLERPLQSIAGMCVHPGGSHNGIELDEFALDITETTLGEYDECVAAHACRGVQSWNRDAVDKAVGYVAWFDAAAYCEWKGKSLPTWDQWTWALIGGDADLPYPWGYEPPDCERYVAPDGDCSVTEGLYDWVPVGSRPLGASRYGCLDLVGGAAEWLHSIDRVWPEIPSPRIKVGVLELHRSQAYYPWDSDDSLGFRCAQNLASTARGSLIHDITRSAKIDPSAARVPVSFVRIADGPGMPAFEIMANEVTAAQYAECVEAGRCPAPAKVPGCATGSTRVATIIR